MLLYIKLYTFLKLHWLIYFFCRFLLLFFLFQLCFETLLPPLLFLITFYYLSFGFFVFFSMLVKKSFLHILPFLYYLPFLLSLCVFYFIIDCRKIQYFFVKNKNILESLFLGYFLIFVFFQIILDSWV